eukprot:7685663-Pyramimonas_sp.AAC.1
MDRHAPDRHGQRHPDKDPMSLLGFEGVLLVAEMAKRRGAPRGAEKGRSSTRQGSPCSACCCTVGLRTAEPHATHARRDSEAVRPPHSAP